MDSVIVVHDKSNKAHVTLPMSDLLGELKDEYGDVLSVNPSWYVSEFIAFGPKMYQLIFKDRKTGKMVKWLKTMKGISMKGNFGMFSSDKLPMYRNPVIDFCSVLQYGSANAFSSIDDIRVKMLDLKKARCQKSKEAVKQSGAMTVSITFSQNVFKRKLSHVFMDEFIMSQPIKKQVRVMQSKRFPKPDKNVPFGVTFLIGWR